LALLSDDVCILPSVVILKLCHPLAQVDQRPLHLNLVVQDLILLPRNLPGDVQHATGKGQQCAA
jgi:hypothetical protein